MKFPRINTLHRFEPVLFDRLQGNTSDIPSGTLVRVIQPNSCPKNGTMGMGYVEYANTKEFIGLVCRDSLQPVNR